MAETADMKKLRHCHPMYNKLCNIVVTAAQSIYEIRNVHQSTDFVSAPRIGILTTIV